MRIGYSLALVVLTIGCARTNILVRDKDDDQEFTKLPAYTEKNALATKLDQLFVASNSSAGRILRVDLANVAGNQYFVDVKIGNPARKFRVLLSLNTCDLMVMAKECPIVEASRPPSIVYDASSSIDHQPTRIRGIVKLPKQQMSGLMSLDTVEFAGFQLARQIILPISQIEGQFPSGYMPFDGILGLNIDLERAKTNATGPFGTLVNEKRLRKNMFSLSLINQSTETGGVLVLGGIDDRLHEGPITWTPITRHGSSLIWLDSFELRHSTSEDKVELYVCLGGCHAQLDTAESMILGPEEQVRRINGLLNTTELSGQVFKLPSCALGGLPNLVFEISGRKFVLSPDAYVVDSANGDCYSALRISQQPGAWILGAPFMRRHYVAFDFDSMRIGVANPAYASN